MINTLYAQKIGMTEAYVGEVRRGVTVLTVMPMQIAHHKTIEKDGYESTQVIFGNAIKKPSKTILGHLKKSKTQGKYLREITGVSDLELGNTLDVSSIVVPGVEVSITSTSKGKGLAGVVKKWHFAGGPRTHGQSDRLRRAGSIGQGTTPGRVYLGKKMSGRMGNSQVTVKSATILSFDPSTNKLIISGPVPGHVGAIVKIVAKGAAPSSYPIVTLTKANLIKVTKPETTESETL
ncbi:MAG: 50S ribosomal protein L3 [Candidatus Moraniibacteriota bacterium]|nr:MAG: 50S ribosomal protein L3 [Candidatus Moranbacteria bacterium]